MLPYQFHGRDFNLSLRRIVKCSDQVLYMDAWGSWVILGQNTDNYHIWVISPSHSKNMLVLVKIAILQSLSFFIQ